MIKKAPAASAAGAFFVWSYVAMAYARATTQRWHYPKIVELFRERKVL